MVIYETWYYTATSHDSNIAYGVVLMNHHSIFPRYNSTSNPSLVPRLHLPKEGKVWCTKFKSLDSAEAIYITWLNEYYYGYIAQLILHSPTMLYELAPIKLLREVSMSHAIIHRSSNYGILSSS